MAIPYQFADVVVYNTIPHTVYRVEFEIDNEIRGGIDRLLFQNVKPFDLTLGKLAQGRARSFVPPALRGG